MARDYLAIATEYASRAILGEEGAGVIEILACQRFIDDLKKADKGDWAYHMDADAASRACMFAELLPHVKGRGGLIKLEPWQVFVYVNIFGWRDEQGFRRFRNAYLEVGRKNGKSTMIAPIGLYCLAMDGEEGSEVYSAATKRDQAAIVWGVAQQMVQRTPILMDRFGLKVTRHAIMHPASGSTFQPVSRDAKRLDGLNIYLALIDELHAHANREMYDVLETATGARAQPLLLSITTAGVDTSGICYEQRTYVMKILNGTQVDDTYFGMIFTIDPGDIDNWSDPKVWRKANPNLGVSVSISDLQRKAEKARSMPSARGAFLRYHLNVWGEGEQQWLSPSRWNQRAVPFDKQQFIGKRAVVALDLASKVDVAAALVVFRLENGAYFAKPCFWVPEKRIVDNDSYRSWADDGWLMTTPGETIDFGAIEESLIQICKDYDVWAVPYDRFQAVQFATRMTEQKVPMVEFAQVVSKMSEPMKAVEAMTIDGRLYHDGNPMMSWMIGNVDVLVDRKDNIYPRKARPENKIDGPVALIMAMAMWLGEEVPKISKYKNGSELIALGSA